MCANGNSVTYNPSTDSKSDQNTLQMEGVDGNTVVGNTSEDSNSDDSALQSKDANEDNNKTYLLNTYSSYIFDVVNIC